MKLRSEPRSMRFKFVCSSKSSHSVYLSPVHSGSDENEQFGMDNPGGWISLQFADPSALYLFEVGKEYFVDFHPSEESEEEEK